MRSSLIVAILRVASALDLGRNPELYDGVVEHGSRFQIEGYGSS